MNSKSAPLRPLRLCRTCRRSFAPARATHAFCRPACRKIAHRLRTAEAPAGLTEQLVEELHAVQDAAGMVHAKPHGYLAIYAHLKHAERQCLLLQKRVASLRRELAALPQPDITVRIHHLASAGAALDALSVDCRWVGAYAQEEGAVLVLGT